MATVVTAVVLGAAQGHDRLAGMVMLTAGPHVISVFLS